MTIQFLKFKEVDIYEDDIPTKEEIKIKGSWV